MSSVQSLIRIAAGSCCLFCCVTVVVKVMQAILAIVLSMRVRLPLELHVLIAPVCLACVVEGVLLNSEVSRILPFTTPRKEIAFEELGLLIRAARMTW